MRSLNRATLLGNVGNDPEVKILRQGNTKKVSFSLATSEKFTNKNTGEITETTEWHKIESWGKTGEMVEKYVKKGDKLLVEGKIETQRWELNGEKKSRTIIKMSSFSMMSPPPSSSAATPAQAPATQPSSVQSPPVDDDLPF